MEPETDVIRQVYDEAGNFLTVRPWARPYNDSPESICLQTVGKDNQEYFGKVEVAMTPAMARELGVALINCSLEVERYEAIGKL